MEPRTLQYWDLERCSWVAYDAADVSAATTLDPLPAPRRTLEREPTETAGS
jgi:hypothetical protein